MDDKFKKIDQTNIDSRTGSIKGSDVYNNYYFPKIEKKEQSASSLIDSRTGSIKGSDVYNNNYFPKKEKSEGRHR